MNTEAQSVFKVCSCQNDNGNRVTAQETYIFTRQEVHGPLNVLDDNTAADMRLCRFNPHFSKQVHHTYETV